MPQAVSGAPRPSALWVLASAIVDVLLDVAAVPSPGADVLAREVQRAPGGAFNVASAAARLGLPTYYCGPHGTGPNGDLLRDALAVESIEVVSTATSVQDTGYCLTLVDRRGQRTFVTVVGADAALDPDTSRHVTPGADDALYISGYDLAYPSSGPVVADLVAALHARCRVVCDPGPLLGAVPPGRWAQVAPFVDVLTWSESESRSLPGLRGLVRSDAVVVTRLGAAGARIDLRDGRGWHVPTVKVQPIDTTGAGDVHTGALLAALHHGASWRSAVQQANAAATWSTLHRGGPTGPNRSQLATFSASAGTIAP